ncbi:MAG: UMP kinase, partial [Planctomycetota bacterium]|nr:UMP kinase [Planctomycetota bacterium]
MAEQAVPGGRRYDRVVLKISGEGFCQAGERGISMAAVVHLAEQTRRAAEHGAQIAIVMGGGNILRGAQFTSGNA